MGLISPGSGVRVPPGALFFNWLVSCVPNKNKMVHICSRIISYRPRWRNWTARQTFNLKVVGLSPTRGIIFFVLNDYGLLEKNKYFSTPSGTRTHNLTLRRGAPCPLGHGGLIFSWQSSSAKLRPTHRALNQSRGKYLLWAVGLMVWCSLQGEEGMGSTLAQSCWFFIFN